MNSDDKIVEEVLGDEHALTPSDIFAKQFRRSHFGGYDRREVDDFLEHVADAVENLIVQVRVLKDKAEEQRKAMAELKEVETTLRNALVSAQRFGDDVLDSAKREAHVIVEEARLKKAQAQLAVSRVPAALTRDIHILEQQRSRLRVEMMAILETHRKLIDSLVPEDAVQTPTSFFEAGEPDDLLEHHEPAATAQLAAADAPVADPQESDNTDDSDLEDPSDAETPSDAEAPAEDDAELEVDSGDHILDGLEELVDETPPIREDVEVDPDESPEGRFP